MKSVYKQMESSNEAIEDGHEYKRRNSGESVSSLLGSKVEELQKLKEKLLKAKDEVGQAWSESKALIDELEKQQTLLENAQCRTTISTTILSDLKSQFLSASTSFKSKKEEEIKMNTTSNDINHDISKLEEETEHLMDAREENREARGKLKEELKLKKQRLQALQLTLRAIRLESEAYGASSAEASRFLEHSRMDNDTASLTQEEYGVLMNKAKEENSLAEWRVLVSNEQKNAAERSLKIIARRLQQLKPNKEKETETRDHVEEVFPDVVAVDYTINNEQSGRRKTHESQLFGEPSRNMQIQKLKRSKSRTKQSSMKKKGSILTRIKMCLVKKFKRYFW